MIVLVYCTLSIFRISPLVRLLYGFSVPWYFNKYEIVEFVCIFHGLYLKSYLPESNHTIALQFLPFLKSSASICPRNAGSDLFAFRQAHCCYPNFKSHTNIYPRSSLNHFLLIFKLRHQYLYEKLNE